MGIEQFFPYAFSQHAYVQCNGELIYFQPCGSLLYWNQEEKICDRKQTTKANSPILLTKLVPDTHSNKQDKQNANEDIITTTADK